MLSKLLKAPTHSLFPRIINYAQSTELKPIFVKKRKIKLTQEHISKAQNLIGLIKDVDLFKLSENPQFKNLMNKITELLLVDTPIDQDYVKCVQDFLYEIRKFTPSEISADSSDILNFQLMFKQLSQKFPQTYRGKGFQIRSTLMAENIPKVASFEGLEPRAMALLHYMSTLSELSNNQMKKTLSNYFMRYFMSLTMTKPINNKNYDNKLSDRTENSQVVLDRNVCAILASCINSADTKTSMQSAMSSIIINNINKNHLEFRNQFGMNPLMSIFIQYKTQLENGQKIQKVVPDLFQVFKQFNFNKKKDVFAINTKTNLLQIFDVFVNLANFDNKCNLNSDQDYRTLNNIGISIYIIFKLCQNMKVYVVDQQNNSEKNEKKQSVIPFQLWKSASQITAALAMDRIFNVHKKNILSAILQKYVQFFAQQKPKLKQIHCKKALIRIISYMPIQIINQQIKRNPESKSSIKKAIEYAVQNIHKNEKELNDKIINEFIWLLKMKKNQIIDKEDLLIIIQQIIKQDKQLQFNKLYFFLGETKDSDFISLIPFQKMAKSICQNRDKMQISGRYWSESFSRENKKRQYFQDGFKIISESKYWQIQLLSLHALAILTKKTSELPKIFAKTKSSYKITIQQIQRLFSEWVRPYSKYLASNLQKSSFDAVFNRQTELKLEKTDQKFRPISYIGRYYEMIFERNQCFIQFQLINKILTHPVVEKRFTNDIQDENKNKIIYITILLLGIGDQKNKQTYLQKYSLQKIFPKNMKQNAIFNLKKNKFFESLLNIQQWQYFLKFFQRVRCIYQGKDMFMGYTTQQSVYRNCSVSNDWNSEASNKEINSKYGFQTFDQINSIIIQSFLNQIKHQKTFEENKVKILQYLLTFILQVSSLKTDNIQRFDFSKTINQNKKQRISNLINQIKWFDDNYLADILFKSWQIGLLSEANVNHIINTVTFNRKTSFSKIFCLAFYGRQKAISKGLIQSDSWKQMAREVTLISSQFVVSARWIYVSMIFSSQKLSSFPTLISRISHPLERYIIQTEYNKLMRKQGESQQSIDELINNSFTSQKQDTLTNNSNENYHEVSASKQQPKKKGFFQKKV